jgi:hypothetical protein
MVIKELFDAYEGLWIESSSIDTSGTRDQCVDLFRVYNRKVIGGNDMAGNAVDYFTNYPVVYYDKIPNTPTGVPQLGDVIVWGTTYGTYGHISVCTDIADTKGFTSFDQNDPLKSKCHFQPHTYNGVLGWLRPKQLPIEESGLTEDERRTLDYLANSKTGDNLEGTVRSWYDCYLAKPGQESKVKQLEGFIAKWVEEWKLPEGSNLVEVENEMAKLMVIEDRLQEYRDSIELCVGTFPTDSALLLAHSAIRKQIDILTSERDSLQQKLDESKIPVGYKFLKSWNIWNLMWKLYRKEGD